MSALEDARAALKARDDAAQGQPGLRLEHFDAITVALRALVAEHERLSASTDDDREHIALVLRSLGLTDEPDKYSDGIHSWRCEHPDRYGKCYCFEEAIDYVLTSGLRRRGPITDEMVLAALNAANPRAAAPSLEYWGDDATAQTRAALEAAESAR